MEEQPIINFIDKSAKIGAGTKIWHFARILSGVTIGENCSIGAGVECGVGTIIGNNTRIGAGTFLPPNSVIGSNIFISPNCTFCDDFYPKVNNKGYKACPPILEDNCSVGAGSVILPGVRIGRGSLVGSGSVISRNVPSGVIIRGEPSRISRDRGEQ